MLPKENRITKRFEFDGFFGAGFKKAGGNNISSPFLIVKTKTNKLTVSRIGFIVSNKVDNRSSVRNRVKRYLRETMRLNLDKIKNNLDILIIAQPAIKKKKHLEISNELLVLLRKARVI